MNTAIVRLFLFFAILFGWLQWMWAVRRREVMLPDLTEARARAYGPPRVLRRPSRAGR